MVENKPNPITCPKCGSKRIQKAGRVPCVAVGHYKQRYKCYKCGRTFYLPEDYEPKPED